MAAKKLKLSTGTDIELKIALNHWKIAIETHQTNFPDTYHECTDVSACEPRRYASTDIFIGSPECTNHSLAKGQKRVTEQLGLYDKGIIDPSAERSRATMWDVVRFAEIHKYNALIIENVVDARKWVLFHSWLNAMTNLGYMHECVYLNSMFCWPTPQSRDRMYVVFWKKGNKKPDLKITPPAFCHKCEKQIQALQRWKPGRIAGKYKQQYDYCCPDCGTTVIPYYYAAFNAIDWSNPGKRIGDRKKELSPNTMRRIKYGLDKYSEPFIVNSQYSSGINFRVKSSKDRLPTIATANNLGLAMPFLSLNEHSKTEPQVRKITDSMQTQTTRQSMALIVPYIIDMHKNGMAKSAAEFINTQTAGGINHALIVANKGMSNSKPISDELGCVTTKDYLGLITSESLKSFLSYNYNGDQVSHITEASDTVTTKDRMSLVNYSKPNIEDCSYRMLTPNEVKRAMAFEDSYVITGNSKDQVRQSGNAVTPPAMELLGERVISTLL